MKLTKLTLVLFFIILTAGVLQSQNMTVTLGTGGLFTIKDTSNNYLTLNQPTGQVRILRSLRLEETVNSFSTGIIFKGTNRFIHDFKPTGVDGRNTFIGLNSGNFSMTSSNPWEASNNTAIGYSSLSSLTTGAGNTAVGVFASHLNTTGNNNISFGYYSLFTNTGGSFNTAIGIRTLYNNSGSRNTALGYYTLRYNTSGDRNTALGYYSGYTVTTGSNLTCLGNNAEPTSGSATNQVTLGNNEITSLRCNVTTITSLSDARDKKNIRDLNLGLDFLMNVKPRLFNWDRREWYENNVSDGSKIQETLTAGFIAQELDEVQKSQNAEWLNLVLKDNPEKLEATPGNLLPIIVKAIQELKTENNELKNKNDKLEEKLSKFEQMQSYLVSEIEKLKSNEGEVLKTSSK